MAAALPCAPFPSASFISQAEFVAWRREAQDRLDARYLHECAEITHDEVLLRAGTCALCLRRTTFASPTAGWPARPDGQRVPQWSEALHCDCEDALSSRARAVVHFARSVGGLCDWTRLLLFGAPHACHRRLAAEAGSTTVVPALREAGEVPRLAAADGRFHLAVAVETLHRVPPLATALAELRRALAAGGALIFTVPFRYNAARTVSRNDLAGRDGRLPTLVRESAHEFGWDLLERLRAAGFAEATAHCYWSGELGYLGAFNMIFHAAA
jgi:hypothetical protein